MRCIPGCCLSTGVQVLQYKINKRLNLGLWTLDYRIYATIRTNNLCIRSIVRSFFRSFDYKISINWTRGKIATVCFPELSTGRMDPRVGSGRVGSGRVTILPDFGGSGQHFGF